MWLGICGSDVLLIYDISVEMWGFRKALDVSRPVCHMSEL
jgi:hypothetical protein